jgi:hypothetical protein
LNGLIAEEFSLKLLNAFVHTGAAASINCVDLRMTRDLKFENLMMKLMVQTLVNNKAVPPAASPKQIAIIRQKMPKNTPPTVPSNN